MALVVVGVAEALRLGVAVVSRAVVRGVGRLVVAGAGVHQGVVVASVEVTRHVAFKVLRSVHLFFHVTYSTLSDLLRTYII